MKNKTFKIFVLILSVLVLFSCLAITAFAQEADSPTKISQVNELLEKLPADEENVKETDVDAVLAAKAAYDALGAEEKLEVAVEKITHLNSLNTAIQPFLLERVTTQIKSFPKVKKLKDSDKEMVVKTYKDYLAMSDELKEAMSEKHLATLTDAVRKVAPELLGEGAVSEQSSQKEGKNINYIQIWQIVLIIFVSLIVLGGLVVMVILIVRFISLGDE